jgi:hypothetical protein
MSAREERLLTPQTIAAVDEWLDGAGVFAKGYWQYVDGKLVTVGLRIGQDWNKVVAFFGDTVVRHENGTHTVLSAKDAAELARLRAERHETNEALSDAAEQLRVQRDRIAELEDTLTKYVGVEPTVAKELAYVGRCLDAVYAVCDAAEKQATRWENPLPTPEWVVLIRNAADGVTVNAPALPPVSKQRQAEDPHESELHHTYELGRDLPFIPAQTTGRCPRCKGTFEDCTCGAAA